jgi:hypothetical protein
VGIDSEGFSGGLALFWHESMQVSVEEVNERFIDVLVQSSDDDSKWRLTCVYGEPRVEQRHHMWETLCGLQSRFDLPWLVAGDFNECMWGFEHFSATPRAENQMTAFRDTLEICGLADLGFSGVPHTYDNKRAGNANVKVRLDRATASNSWRNIFPYYSVKHVVTPCSDHVALIIKGEQELPQQRPKRCKQFEIMWERDHALPEIIKKAWDSIDGIYDLGDIERALGSTMTKLHEWSKKKFGSVKDELEKSRSQLEELMNMNADRQEIRRVTDRMNELLYREEMMWLQRSRLTWLKEGDRNTKYFHSKSVWRARKNNIRQLVDDSGVAHVDVGIMQSMATEYFQQLFTADNDLDPTPVVDLIDHCISDEANDRLCGEFSEKEISDALFQIGPLKAPGPDGFPARFFQRNWATLKEKVTAAVQEFFKTGVMPAGANITSIVLIPKVSNPKMLSEYRPISLCNVIYKVVSKCLVNRLRPLLDDIISPSQSAFVPGRMITDNALLAFECIHHIKQEKDPTKSYCAYKLDLSKAYDRVDWSFLRQVMQKLGFSHRFVDWIMSCVTSVRYAVKFNGTLLDSFEPSRGLRQGDPLSPFLFLFVADGLSSLLNKGINENAISPIKVCRRAPGVSHLLFADDTLLFFKANQDEAIHVRQVLDIYASSTGQLINPSKCSLLFGETCPMEVQNDVRSTLNVSSLTFEEKYLGLPTPDGRMSKGKFHNIQAQLTKRLIMWGDGHLAQAGREVFIKSVAQSLPTYLMGVFKLPFSVCDDLTRLVRNFYWGAKDGKRKTHWRSWDKLQRPKKQGGLGFRDFRAFNQALLARQAWRLITKPNSLCARVLKAKYYPNGNLEDTVFSGNASSTWQAISHGLDLLKKGLIWRVGNGQSIRIWRDPWIPRPYSYKLVSPKGRCRLRFVSELLDQYGSWRTDLLYHYFAPADVSEILKISPSARLNTDLLSWSPEKRGLFTVRSAYGLAMDELWRSSTTSSSSAPDGRRIIWDLIWKSIVPPKVHHFAWRLATDALPTWQNKCKRTLEISDYCPLCGMETEDNFHPFFRCNLAQQLWLHMAEVWNIPELNTILYTGSDWLLLLLCNLPEESRGMTLMTLWRIWHVRNEVIHGKNPPPVHTSRRFLVSYWESLVQIKHHPEKDLNKGKFILDRELAHFHGPVEHSIIPSWTVPSIGWCKLNTDGSFVNGNAGAGMIARDHAGAIIFSSCRQLINCREALGAEVSAVREGLVLALHWCNDPLIVELDCLELVVMLQNEEIDRSVYSSVIEEIKTLLKVRQTCVTHVKRCQNNSSHFLADYARTQECTAVWLSSGPEGLMSICHDDCNP